MTNLEKLTKLLCENKEVKKDIMELRQGSRISFEEDVHGGVFNNIFTMTGFKYESHDEDYCTKPQYKTEILGHKNNTGYNNNADILYVCIDVEDEDNLEEAIDEGLNNAKIIGNPIQDHHLRIRAHEQGIRFTISETGVVLDRIYNSEICNEYFKTSVVLDYTKPLHKQNEKVLGDIYEFLIDCK